MSEVPEGEESQRELHDAENAEDDPLRGHRLFL